MAIAHVSPWAMQPEGFSQMLTLVLGKSSIPASCSVTPREPVQMDLHLLQPDRVRHLLGVTKGGKDTSSELQQDSSDQIHDIRTFISMSFKLRLFCTFECFVLTMLLRINLTYVMSSLYRSPNSSAIAATRVRSLHLFVCLHDFGAPHCKLLEVLV